MVKEALNNIVDKIVEALMEWIFTLIYGLYAGLLKIVDLISSFFDIFAGTSKVYYEGQPDFLLNLFFSHDAVSNAFWAMTLIAIVLAFGFAIFGVARSITDISGTVKKSVSQVMSQLVRCVTILLLLNAMIVAGINISNVLLDRINFALLNAEYLDEESDQRTFTEQEYATMTKILATIGNYAANPSYDSRYNMNSCFNAIRGDLYALQLSGVFDYDYPMDEYGHHTWQSALSNLAKSADLTEDLSLTVYNNEVSTALHAVIHEVKFHSKFRPVESVTAPKAMSSTDTDIIIFLVSSMNAARNENYNTGDIYDNLRNGYATGEKDYLDISQVKEDFDIQKFDYVVGLVSAIVFIVIMAICIFTFIVRMFNLVLLYITAPLFVSSMPVDEGAKFQTWLQAFISQLFSGFGQVIAMRLYLIVIPFVMSNDLVFFLGDGLWYSTLNWFARLLMILGGAWAVMKAGGLISSILSGNPGMHMAQQEAKMGSMVTHGAQAAVRDTVKIGKAIGGAAMKAPQAIATAPAKLVGAAQKYRDSFSDPYHAIKDRRISRQEASDKRAQYDERKRNEIVDGVRSSRKNTSRNRDTNQTGQDKAQTQTQTQDAPASGPQQTSAVPERKRSKYSNIKIPEYPAPPPPDTPLIMPNKLSKNQEKDTAVPEQRERGQKQTKGSE